MEAKLTIAEEVLAETKRFRQELPQLLKRYPGRWVVFKNGAVDSDHPDERSAYRAALEKYGPQGGYVVAPVAATGPTPISAGVAFGFARI